MNGQQEEVSPQLLDLISKDNNREWHMDRDSSSSSEERKLELRLGPPGEEEEEGEEDSLLSLGYFSTPTTINGSQTLKKKITTLSSPWTQNNQHNNGVSSFLQSSSSSSKPSSATNTAVPNSSQKRTAPGPVVGWPPIRSFRKNLASTSVSSKTQSPHESQNHQHVDKLAGKKHVLVENNNVGVVVGGGKGLFVKINMDGVPIGRKVDLNAYDSYEKLSTAVDELFRGLLAAQRDSCAGKIQNKQEDKAITGVLDGSGEYTLVYEDNEGDRMLVGDVPWHMFVSTVKRLRVLKSSELSAFTREF
ncbi:auxin-responsive protein IAA26-like [Senna tora]|uniref:Auxin-induced protein n=1 Tax=Senna tora TaxID=362788 RepID=A0A834T4T8_9FABA|nr:auxin-responsive protein IAA26-like [Senna tora]